MITIVVAFAVGFAVVFAGVGAVAHTKYGASHADALFLALGASAALTIGAFLAVSIVSLLK